MNYKDASFIHLRFPDGSLDVGEHPYVCLLDSNSTADSYHLLKGKTYHAAKHLKYVLAGTDKIINLQRPTLVNLKEPTEMGFSDESILNPRFIKKVNDSEFQDIANAYYDLNCSLSLKPNVFERDQNILKKYLHK